MGFAEYFGQDLFSHNIEEAQLVCVSDGICHFKVCVSGQTKTNKLLVNRKTKPLNKSYFNLDLKSLLNNS